MPLLERNSELFMSTWNALKLIQPTKAESLIVDKLSGISIDSSLEQLEKAKGPIDRSPDGKITESKLMHPENAA